MNILERVRPGLQLLLAWLLQVTGCFWWAQRQLRRRGAVVVLTFHRVLDHAQYENTCSLPGIVVRRRTFDSLAGYVAGKFEPVDFAKALEPAAGKVRMMFTLDDGWRDSYTNAFPVLRKRGIPATLFVCPGLIERSLPFWPETVAALLGKSATPVSRTKVESLIETLKTYTNERREQFIAQLYELYAPEGSNDSYEGDRTVSWENIGEMAAGGITVGCHTHTHQILTTVTPQMARREVRESKRAIEATLEQHCDLFAYPNGNSSSETRRMLAEEGFAAAFTTQRGAWTSQCDRMAIPRLNVSEASVAGLMGRFSPALFQYNVLWKAWRALQSQSSVPVEPRREPVLSRA